MKKYPFKFLNAYNRNDTDIFFGREEEIEQLYQMAFQSDMLLVYGASGTGKTSLINCGLASRFQTHDWLALEIRRRNNINISLQNQLAAAEQKTETPDLDLDWLDEEDEEVKKPLSALAKQFQNIYRQYFRPIYLIFDQFEELYILGNKEEQAQFIETIKEILALEQPVKVIFIIREEYLGHLYEFERAVPQLLRKKLRVEPMTLDKVHQVISGAAAYAHTNIYLQKGEEDQVIEALFNKIKGDQKTLSIQLPYLQVFLDKFYLHLTGDESRKADATFTLKGLVGMGDIVDVLRDFLEEQVLVIERQLKKAHKDLPENATWQILSPFATLDGTKDPLSLAELHQRLPDFSEQVLSDALKALGNSRILNEEENLGIYELTHDSLAKRIAEKRSDEEIALLEIRNLITSQLALKEYARDLLTEKQLNFIEPYLDKLSLNEEEQALVDQSRDAIAAQKAEEKRQAEAEKQRLLERQQLLEKNQKNQRRFIGILGIVLLGVIGLLFWALNQQKTAKDRLEEIERNQAFAYAREQEAFGDSYRGLQKDDFACDSYQQGLDTLKNYQQDSVIQQYFQLIEAKKKKTCEE